MTDHPHAHQIASGEWFCPDCGCQWDGVRDPEFPCSQPIPNWLREQPRKTSRQIGNDAIAEMRKIISGA